MDSRPLPRKAKVAARNAIAVADEEEKRALRALLHGEPKLSSRGRESNAESSPGAAGFKRGRRKAAGLRGRLSIRKTLSEKRGIRSAGGKWQLRRSTRKSLRDLADDDGANKEEEEPKVFDLGGRDIGPMPDDSGGRRLKEEKSDVEMNEDALESTDRVERLMRMTRGTRMRTRRQVNMPKESPKRECADKMKDEEGEKRPQWGVEDRGARYLGREARDARFWEEARKKRVKDDVLHDKEEEEEVVESGVGPVGRMDVAENEQSRDGVSSMVTKEMSRRSCETGTEDLQNARNEWSMGRDLPINQGRNTKAETLGRRRRTRAVRNRIPKRRRKRIGGVKEAVARSASSNISGGSLDPGNVKATRHSKGPSFAGEIPRITTRSKRIGQILGQESFGRSRVDENGNVKRVESPVKKTGKVAEKSRMLDAERSMRRRGRDPRLRLRIREGTLEGQRHKFCEAVVRDLLRREDAKPFSEPIHKLWSVDQLPRYFDIIKTPMDLGTVLHNLESGEYRRKDSGEFDVAFFSADVRTVFLNSLKYNEAETEFYKAARALLDDFEDAMRQLPNAESPGGSRAGGSSPRKTSASVTGNSASKVGSLVADLEKRATENELKYLKVKRDYIRDRAGELAVSRENYLCHWEKLKIRDAIASVYNDEEKMKAIIRVIRRQVFDALRGIRRGDVLPEYVDIDIDDIPPCACREIFDICTPDRRDNLLRLKAELKETDERIEKLENELKNFGSAAT